MSVAAQTRNSQSAMDVDSIREMECGDVNDRNIESVVMVFLGSKEFSDIKKDDAKGREAKKKLNRHLSSPGCESNHGGNSLPVIRHRGDLRSLASKITSHGFLFNSVKMALTSSTRLNVDRYCFVLSATEGNRGNNVVLALDVEAFAAKIDFGEGSSFFLATPSLAMPGDGKKITTNVGKSWILFYCSLVEEKRGFEHRVLNGMDSKERASFTLFSNYMGLA